MSHCRFFALCCALLPLTAARVQAQSATLKQPIQISLLGVNAEKGLFEFARTAKIDVLVDSTHVDPDITTTGRYNDWLVKVLSPFTQEHFLSTSELDPKTFLFWGEPEIKDVVRAAIKSNPLRVEAGTPNIAAFAKMFYAYVAEHPEATPKLTTEFRLDDLPLELRKALAAVFIDQSLNHWTNPYPDSWFDDEFWKRARVALYRANNVVQQGVLAPEILSPFLVRGTIPKEPSSVAVERTALGYPLRTEVLNNADEKIGDTPQEKVVPTAPEGTSLRLLQDKVVKSPIIDLSADAKLAVPLTLEVTRLPLREALKQISKQSKVSLTCADSVAPFLLSAHTQEMPLWRALNALSHLYGVTWRVQGNGYHADDTSAPLERQILQLGDWAWYRFREKSSSSLPGREQVLRELNADVRDAVGERALNAPDGVAFTSLPEDLQQRVREQIEEKVAMDFPVITAQRRIQEVREGDLSFRFQPTRGIDTLWFRINGEESILLDFPSKPPVPHPLPHLTLEPPPGE